MITKFDKYKAEEIRQDVLGILITSRPPKKNISNEGKQALRELQQNKEIIILLTDKGNVTVVLDLEDFTNKIRALLHDPTYLPITIDPTAYLEKTTKITIKIK